MASVFLSYARGDADKARPIAAALEKAGHSVWWDQQIGGGSQFSKEIERALNAADVVVVLWSPSSVESAWVRDEAGTGRDKGRLVPLTLAGTLPPLGFRQFHAIDLGGWKGRGKVPRAQEILAAIERQTKEPGIPPSVETSPRPRRGDGPSLNMWLLIALGVGMFFVVIGLLIGRPWERGTSARIPLVSIAPADGSDGSKAMGKTAYSKLSALGDTASGKWQLIQVGSREQPDLLFQTADHSSEGHANATITLLRAKDRTVLWSRDFNRSGGSRDDIHQQAALTAARVLGCTADGINPGGKPLRQQVLKLYVSACAQWPEGGNDGVSTVVPVFQKVVSEAPSFEPGWAKLLLAETSAFSAVEDDATRQSLQQHIERARQLDQRMPEATVAQAALLPIDAYGEALRLLDEALSSKPDNPAILVFRTGALLKVGRLSDAIADAQKAAELDPTSPEVLRNYVLALAYSGRIDAAREQLRHAERLWSDTGTLRDLRYAFHLRFGDPKELIGTREFNESPPMMQFYFRTRADPTPANIDRFIASLDQLHRRRGAHAADVAGHAQPYGEFHRENELYRLIAQVPADEDVSLFSEVAFRPALRKFRQDPRFMIVAKRMGLVDYWQKSGKWPDFCFLDPDQPYDCKAEAAKLK